MKLRMRGPLVPAGLLAWIFGAVVAANAQDISDSAYQQIRALLLEKESRSGLQRKLSPSLVYAGDAIRGVSPGNVTDLGDPATTLHLGPQGALVKIKATVSAELLDTIQRLGGRVIYSSAARGSIQARVPINFVEALAARGDVQSISASFPAQSDERLAGQPAAALSPAAFRDRQNCRPTVPLRPVPRLIVFYRFAHEPRLHHAHREHCRANVRREGRRHPCGYSLGFG